MGVLGLWGVSVILPLNSSPPNMINSPSLSGCGVRLKFLRGDGLSQGTYCLSFSSPPVVSLERMSSMSSSSSSSDADSPVWDQDFRSESERVCVREREREREKGMRYEV